MGVAGIALTSRVGKVFAAEKASGTAPLNKWPGRVVINFNKAGVTSSGVADATVIKKMVDDAILLLTGETTLAAAWQSIFPTSLTATSKIAIKIPVGFNDGLPAPHWASVKAITDGLQQMTLNGTNFPVANITIYDMAGTGTFAHAGYTAANFPDISILKDTAIDGGDGALSNRTYAQTLKNADFLINVFSPRGHSIGSSYSIGFKCHYGTYSDPAGMHTDAPQNLRDINCEGPVYNKNVLSVCSGIYGMNEGHGPEGSADIYTTYAQSIDITSTNQCPTTIIMSTDPVSAEMQTIKMMRINKSETYATTDMPDYLKASGGVMVSGWLPINTIGIIDESAMDIRKIINGVSMSVLNPGSNAMSVSGTGIAAHHIKGHNTTFIEFILPDENIGKDACVEIYSSKGALVRKFSRKVLGVRTHFSWDEMNERGGTGPVSKGTYIVHLICGEKLASAPFTIVR
jgi:hypothetical protein